MAVTKIADVIVPELFNPYVVNRTMELSAFIQCGIVVNSPEFDKLASEAARTHNMPFFEDLSGESEATLEDVEMTPAKIGSNKDVSTTILRQKMWGASNLSAALAGADPMKAIGDLVAAYWARDMQKELIAILSGVFGTFTPEGGTATTRMADHILDLTKATSAAAKIISAEAFIDACQLLGDAQAQLSGIVMHSATKSYLKKKNLIATERDSTDVEFDTYQGRRVTVDDGCPVDKDNNYTSYLFGNGAVALGNGNPVGHVPTETDRDKRIGGGVDYIINRKAYILHPRGIAYTKAVREHVETPTREELANPQNWNPVYEPKQLRIVALKHKLG
ncbi:MAG: phage major capsid protein [Lachnospiraceae bacterium]|nr:phage major capsid protein [Lachnospiraceae bacterium]